jgi:hypothetical protein
VITIAPNAKVPFGEELSKNIAVFGFGFINGSGNGTNTAALGSAAVLVTSPIYLPIAADFRGAPAQTYTTSTLTVELVTQ